MANEQLQLIFAIRSFTYKTFCYEQSSGSTFNFLLRQKSFEFLTSHLCISLSSRHLSRVHFSLSLPILCSSDLVIAKLSHHNIYNLNCNCQSGVHLSHSSTYTVRCTSCNCSYRGSSSSSNREIWIKICIWSIVPFVYSCSAGALLLSTFRNGNFSLLYVRWFYCFALLCLVHLIFCVKIEPVPCWLAKCQKQNVKRLMTMDACMQFYLLNVPLVIKISWFFHWWYPNLFSPAMQSKCIPSTRKQSHDVKFSFSALWIELNSNEI